MHISKLLRGFLLVYRGIVVVAMTLYAISAFFNVAGTLWTAKDLLHLAASVCIYWLTSRQVELSGKELEPTGRRRILAIEGAKLSLLAGTSVFTFVLFQLGEHGSVNLTDLAHQVLIISAIQLVLSSLPIAAMVAYSGAVSGTTISVESRRMRAWPPILLRRFVASNRVLLSTWIVAVGAIVYIHQPQGGYAYEAGRYQKDEIREILIADDPRFASVQNDELFAFLYTEFPVLQTWTDSGTPCTVAQPLVVGTLVIPAPLDCTGSPRGWYSLRSEAKQLDEVSEVLFALALLTGVCGMLALINSRR
jgi:hypothetical protein